MVSLNSKATSKHNRHITIINWLLFIEYATLIIIYKHLIVKINVYMKINVKEIKKELTKLTITFIKDLWKL